MDDVIAVMDAAGVERGAVMGQLEGGAMSALFAATHPDRVTHLVLYATFARVVAGEGYEWAPSKEERNANLGGWFDTWGTGARLPVFAPSLAGDESMRRWMGRFERGSATPGIVRSFLEAMGELDVRDVLPSIQAPTLVMRRKNDPFLDPRHTPVPRRQHPLREVRGAARPRQPDPLGRHRRGPRRDRGVHHRRAARRASIRIAPWRR